MDVAGPPSPPAKKPRLEDDAPVPLSPLDEVVSVGQMEAVFFHNLKRIDVRVQTVRTDPAASMKITADGGEITYLKIPAESDVFYHSLDRHREDLRRAGKEENCFLVEEITKFYQSENSVIPLFFEKKLPRGEDVDIGGMRDLVRTTYNCDEDDSFFVQGFKRIRDSDLCVFVYPRILIRAGDLDRHLNVLGVTKAQLLPMCGTGSCAKWKWQVVQEYARSVESLALPCLYRNLSTTSSSAAVFPVPRQSSSALQFFPPPTGDDLRGFDIASARELMRGDIEANETDDYPRIVTYLNQWFCPLSQVSGFPVLQRSVSYTSLGSPYYDTIIQSHYAVEGMLKGAVIVVDIPVPGKDTTRRVTHTAASAFQKSGLKNSSPAFNLFPPGVPIHDGYINIWPGHSFSDTGPLAEDELFAVRLWKRVIYHVICSGRQPLYEYVINMLAYAVQTPGKRWAVAMVIQGGQGIGKTLAFNAVQKTFGPMGMYDCGTFDPRVRFQLTRLINKVFVVSDEADKCNGADRSASYNAYKSLITESSFTAEWKYQNPVEVNNFCNFVLLCNNNIWALEADDRRVFYVSASRSVPGSIDLAKLGELVDAKDGDKSLFRGLSKFLRNVDVQNFNPRDVPDTQEKMRKIVEDMACMRRWWWGCLVRGWHSVPSGSCRGPYNRPDSGFPPLSYDDASGAGLQPTAYQGILSGGQLPVTEYMMMEAVQRPQSQSKWYSVLPWESVTLSMHGEGGTRHSSKTSLFEEFRRLCCPSVSWYQPPPSEVLRFERVASRNSSHNNLVRIPPIEKCIDDFERLINRVGWVQLSRNLDITSSSE